MHGIFSYQASTVVRLVRAIVGVWGASWDVAYNGFRGGGKTVFDDTVMSLSLILKDVHEHCFSIGYCLAIIVNILLMSANR